MKLPIPTWPVSILLACLAVGVRAQGNFRNLGFEDAQLPAIPLGQYGDLVAIGVGLPGWQGHIGANEVSTVLHNNFTLGAAAISILGPNRPSADIIAGRYTVWLRAGAGFYGEGAGASISQVGTIPADARSLRYSAVMYQPGQFARLDVMFDGRSLQPVPLRESPRLGAEWLTLGEYGVDVTAVAGRSGELRFTAPIDYPGQPLGPNIVYLDAIQFSPVLIPEPGLAGLLLLGLLVFFRSSNRQSIHGADFLVNR